MGNICGKAESVDTGSHMDPQSIHGSGDDREEEYLHHSTIPTLLPVPDTLVKPNDLLCATCREIDLDATRFSVTPDDEEEEKRHKGVTIDLGLVEDLKKKTNCPLCRLVLTALGPELSSAENGEPLFVTLTWATEISVRNLRPNIWKEKGRRRHGDMKRLNVYPEITLLANDAPTTSTLYYVRPIKDFIDFEMIRNWLFMCEDWHGDECSRVEILDRPVNDPAVEIPSFRVIDVINNCITFAPNNCIYVALSYVWGRIDPNSILRTVKANLDALSTPGALAQQVHHDRMPLTIRDAMKVVRELQLQYLWVDSLCIIQDDDGPGGSKLDAISKMDLVYGAAYLTIIAATGTDAHAGLPGVYPAPRNVSQNIEQIHPGLRLAFRPKYQDYIPRSAYYTRAWTFQEQKFSKRSLTFIGGQAVYRCKQYQWREDTVFEDRECYYVMPPAQPNQIPDDMARFQSLIQAYSGLSMTYDTDIYHAFAGMVRYIKAELGASLCHGIPDADFDWFLLWKSMEPQERRAGTPSWSWSGWRGEVQPLTTRWYTRSVSKIRELYRERTWIIWFERKAHDSEACHLVWTPDHEQDASTTDRPTNFYGIPSRTRFKFDCSRTLPTPRKLVNAPRYVDNTYYPIPGSGFLQFWTVSVSFNLGEPVKRPSPSFEARNTCTRVGIFGRNGNEVGTIFVHPDWHDSNIRPQAREPHEFILLCEGRDVDPGPAYGGGIDEEKEWKFVAMLIDWRRDGQWAERVALTFFEKTCLDQALGDGPAWKEIVLG